ncbi:unnamed protein product [Acanthoscelides obtectus]|uniref:Uncharacterized protein n=1 Tax=Acanthoscelides obtectus TaxID=200917 RepID=A0A9P0L8H4_ACAOB|nr:unnamed protein product [Acanthoscelides obtectus]CAK1671083.1 hypothetical protein AOBTE_LOCUS28045 [Acanthoscelides obtectus]
MLKKLTSSGYRVNVAISTEPLEYPIPANRHVFVMSLECENFERALEIIRCQGIKASGGKIFVKLMYSP